MSAAPFTRIVNPATDELIAEIANQDATALDSAVTRATAAADLWYDTVPAERAAYLLRLADAIEAHAEELAQIESRNVGKPIVGARIEVMVGADMLRFFAGAARRIDGLAANEYAPGFTSMLRREPLGVVAVVAPWNYPFMLTCTKIGSVIGAGNAMVAKPADFTPMSALRLAEIADGVLPEGLFQVLTGTGAGLGQAMVEHPGMRGFALTGGTETGRRVAEIGGRHLKRMQLELGSKNAAIAFDDARPEEVANSVIEGAFVNSGQDCGAASRLLVHESRYTEVIDALLAGLEGFSVGDPSSEETRMGPLFTRAHQQRVLGMIERARADGGTILTGGNAIGEVGAFVQPTLITDVGQKDHIVQNEVFGPVVTIQKFSTDAEAIAMANDVDSGLAASVFSQDVRRSMNAVRKLQFGTTWINDHIPMALELPWSGSKNAGNGADNSIYALEQFTQLKHVMIKL